MQLWRSLDDVPADLARTVVTIGNFDGVHLGHRRVLARARRVADERDLALVVVTFDPHPMAVLRPEHAPDDADQPSSPAPSCSAAPAPTRCWRCPSTATWPPGRPRSSWTGSWSSGLGAAVVVANFRFGTGRAT